MTENRSANLLLKLEGYVTSGTQKGREFISKSGYTRQFINRLEYEPFPGTLNIELDDESCQNRHMIDDLESVLIREWSDGENSFGAVLCYPAHIETSFDTRHTEECHVIVPERTDHEKDVLEVISSKNLRENLGLADGHSVEVSIHEP